MNMFDEARTLRAMLDMCGMTQSEIADKLGVSQSYVANKLRLLNFSERCRELITDAALTERHARLLLRIKDEEKIIEAIERIRSMHLSVAASEAMVDAMLLENMTRSLGASRGDNPILKFEKIIDEGIRGLTTLGVSARRSVDRCGRKKYITVCIEE